MAHNSLDVRSRVGHVQVDEGAADDEEVEGDTVPDPVVDPNVAVSSAAKPAAGAEPEGPPVPKRAAGGGLDAFRRMVDS